MTDTQKSDSAPARHSESIVVGVDSEAPSTLAARWAALRAASRGSTIELVTAIDELADDPLEVAERLRAVTTAVLEVSPGLQVTTAVIEGSIRNVLMQRAETADLLVLGFHRSRPIRSLLTGEVALAIAAESVCPTVVVPEDWDEKDARGPVLVGMEVDGSSDAALEFAATEALDGRELHLVHAWRLPPSSVDAVEALIVERPQDIAWHRKLLAEAADGLRDAFPGVAVREQLTESFPAAALIQEARRCSLVVVGSHGRGELGSLLLGSTARDVMRNTATPVCVVPRPDDEAPRRHNGRVSQAV